MYELIGLLISLTLAGIGIHCFLNAQRIIEGANEPSLYRKLKDQRKGAK
tara:strand:+ start:94 stop:240 length:147 start_codon:yes stop_codon:yes gene_type:complete